MDDIRVDFSEFDRLAVDVGDVVPNAGRYIRSAVEVTARHIKDDWKDEAKGMAHAPAFPNAIHYDVSVFQGFGRSQVEAEIGPDKDRPQGALGNLIEYGSVNNRPQGLGHGALERNADDLERGLVKALEDAERVAFTDSSLGRAAAAVVRGSYG